MPDSKSCIDRIRDITKRRVIETIDGVPVDVMTAEMVVQMFDQAKPANKEKYRTLSVRQLIARAMKKCG